MVQNQKEESEQKIGAYRVKDGAEGRGMVTGSWMTGGVMGHNQGHCGQIKRGIPGGAVWGQM